MSRSKRHKKPAYARRNRHADIMRLMKQSSGETSVQTALKRVLNAVNATGFLADLQRRAPATRHMHGPKQVHGDAWAGVVVWMKGTGYYGYKTLTLIGVWVIQQDDDAYTLLVGTRHLPYTAPFYSAEAYFHQIKRDFRRYYEGDVSPPSNALYRGIYTPEKRLAIRERIQTTLTAWRKTLNSSTSL